MNRRVSQQALLVTSIGSILEYYDFVIYALLTNYLKSVFFPIGNANVATLQVFLVFAVGYIVRPFGGILAGMIGDRFGRKPAFSALTALMAVSTLALGCLPTFSQVGFLAPTLLVICRLCQGLSFGGELPGAATIIGEFSTKQKRGFNLSMIVASVSTGALLASFVLFCLTGILSEADIVRWGWRLPFLIGGGLGIGLFWLRKDLKETPIFQTENQALKAQNPFTTLLRDHLNAVLTGILLTVLIAALVVVNLFFPYYIPQYFGYPEKDVYLCTTLSLVFSSLILPITGKMADRFSKYALLRGVTLSYLFLSCLFFNLLSYQNLYLLQLFLLIHQAFIALTMSCYYPIMIKLFPPEVRYTGIATCYNLVYALMGILPTLLTTLLNYLQNPLVVPIVLSMVATISYMGILLLKNRPEKEGLCHF
jgi:MHS family proline/betaine transporter-like MFS transporter